MTVMSDAVTRVLDQVARECERGISYARSTDGVMGIALYELGKVIEAESEAGKDTQGLESVNKRVALALDAGTRLREAIYAVRSAIDTIR
jgi:hypothetical protein